MNNLLHNPYCRPFYFQGETEHAVLLIHGFTASPSTMLPLGRTLSESGLTVKGMLLPGHCTSLQEMEKTNWSDWLNAAYCEFDILQSKFNKVSVVGLSMGGTLTLLLAENRAVYQAVPIAAALIVKNWFSHFAPLVWPFYRYQIDSAHTNYKEFLQEYNLGYDKTPVRNVADLNHLMKLAKKDLHKIKCPILNVCAGDDETVSPKSSKLIMSRVSSLKKCSLVLKNSPHICTLGQDRTELSQEIIRFLKAKREVI